MISDNKEASSRIAKAASTVKIGDPGTAIYGGYIVEGERNPKLVGSRKYQTYSSILADVAIVGAAVRYFLNLVGNAKWTIEVANESTEAARYAEELKIIKSGLKSSWSRIIRKAATYKFYGFSVQVWTAKKMDNGLIGINRIDVRPQSTIERWHRDKWGDVETIVQRLPQTMQDADIPRNRCVYIVDDALNDSPEGLGLFRHIAEPAERLLRLQVLEGISFEHNLAGIPIVRGPYAKLQAMVKNNEMTEADRLSIIAPLQKLAANHVKTAEMAVMLDSLPYSNDDGSLSSTPQWAFDLLQGTNDGQEEVAAAIRRETESIARVLNASGLMLGSGPTGSRALGDVEADNLGMVVESTLTEISEAFNLDFVGTLGSLNGWNPELLPKLKHEAVNIKSILAVTAALKDLASAGSMMNPDDPADAYIRENLGVPAKPAFDSAENELDSALTGNRPNRNTREVDIETPEEDNENGTS